MARASLEVGALVRRLPPLVELLRVIRLLSLLLLLTLIILLLRVLLLLLPSVLLLGILLPCILLLRVLALCVLMRVETGRILRRMRRRPRTTPSTASLPPMQIKITRRPSSTTTPPLLLRPLSVVLLPLRIIRQHLMSRLYPQEGLLARLITTSSSCSSSR